MFEPMWWKGSKRKAPQSCCGAFGLMMTSIYRASIQTACTTMIGHPLNCTFRASHPFHVPGLPNWSHSGWRASMNEKSKSMIAKSSADISCGSLIPSGNGLTFLWENALLERSLPLTISMWRNGTIRLSALLCKSTERPCQFIAAPTLEVVNERRSKFIIVMVLSVYSRGLFGVFCRRLTIYVWNDIIIYLAFVNVCSATWTRTRNQSITSILKLLLGMDYIITIMAVGHLRCKALGAVQRTELLPEGIVSEPSRHFVSLGCWLSYVRISSNSPCLSFLNFFRKLRNVIWTFYCHSRLLYHWAIAEYLFVKKQVAERFSATGNSISKNYEFAI